MTPGGNNVNYFPENQLTKFSAKSLISNMPELQRSLMHRVEGERCGCISPLDPPLYTVYSTGCNVQIT